MAAPSAGDPINPTGINVVWDSPDAALDIVFVHGLDGHPYQTWTSEGPEGVFWPRDLLPESLKDQPARILTYGYEATILSLSDSITERGLSQHGEALAYELTVNRNRSHRLQKPIVFVCHSLGGLVVKAALLGCSGSKLNRRIKALYVSTHGVIFLTTPHFTSGTLRGGVILQSIANSTSRSLFVNSAKDLASTLQSRTATLRGMDERFKEHLSKFRIACFHETRPTSLPGTKKLIVDVVSAVPPDLIGQCDTGGIAADHQGICRFGNKNDDGYKQVADIILKFSLASIDSVTQKWKAFLQEEGDNNPGEDELKVIRSPTLISNTLIFLGPLDPYPNRFVFGRAQELEALRQHLLDPKGKVRRTSSVLLHSDDGFGKSRLARQFIYQSSESYTTGVFWIDARTINTCKESFLTIAEELVQRKLTKPSKIERQEPDGLISMVRRWLESKDDWLMVFDGIAFGDKSLRAFKQFLPQSRRSSIIYTSCDKGLCKKTSLFEPLGVRVGPLDKEIAKHMLFFGLHIETPTKDQNATATKLVERYKCQPLAIRTVCCMLHACGLSLDGFEVPIGPMPCVDELYDYLYEKFKTQPEMSMLVNLLSFYDHHIPLQMIYLGAPFLAKFCQNSETEESGKEDKEICVGSTIGGLVQSGLGEWSSSTYFAQEDKDNSQNQGKSDASGAKCQSLEHGGLDGRVYFLDIFSTAQFYFRTRLTENKGLSEWWLGLAAMMLIYSYRNTYRDPEDGGASAHHPIRELRHFRAHGRSILDHFYDVTSGSLKLMKQYFAKFLDTIDEEIKRREEAELFGADSAKEEKSGKQKTQSIPLKEVGHHAKSIAADVVTGDDCDIPWPEQPTDMTSVTPSDILVALGSNSDDNEHEDGTNNTVESEASTPHTARPEYEETSATPKDRSIESSVDSSERRTPTPPQPPSRKPDSSLEYWADQEDELLLPEFQVVEGKRRHRAAESPHKSKDEQSPDSKKQSEAKSKLKLRVQSGNKDQKKPPKWTKSIGSVAWRKAMTGEEQQKTTGIRLTNLAATRQRRKANESQEDDGAGDISTATPPEGLASRQSSGSSWANVVSTGPSFDDTSHTPQPTPQDVDEAIGEGKAASEQPSKSANDTDTTQSEKEAEAVLQPSKARRYGSAWSSSAQEPDPQTQQEYDFPPLGSEPQAEEPAWKVDTQGTTVQQADEVEFPALGSEPQPFSASKPQTPETKRGLSHADDASGHTKPSNPESAGSKVEGQSTHSLEDDFPPLVRDIKPKTKEATPPKPQSIPTAPRAMLGKDNEWPAIGSQVSSTPLQTQPMGPWANVSDKTPRPRKEETLSQTQAGPPSGVQQPLRGWADALKSAPVSDEGTTRKDVPLSNQPQLSNAPPTQAHPSKSWADALKSTDASTGAVTPRQSAVSTETERLVESPKRPVDVLEIDIPAAKEHQSQSAVEPETPEEKRARILAEMNFDSTESWADMVDDEEEELLYSQRGQSTSGHATPQSVENKESSEKCAVTEPVKTVSEPIVSPEAVVDKGPDTTKEEKIAKPSSPEYKRYTDDRKVPTTHLDPALSQHHPEPPTTVKHGSTEGVHRLPWRRRVSMEAAPSTHMPPQSAPTQEPLSRQDEPLEEPHSHEVGGHSSTHPTVKVPKGPIARLLAEDQSTKSRDSSSDRTDTATATTVPTPPMTPEKSTSPPPEKPKSGLSRELSPGVSTSPSPTPADVSPELASQLEITASTPGEPGKLEANDEEPVEAALEPLSKGSPVIIAAKTRKPAKTKRRKTGDRGSIDQQASTSQIKEERFDQIEQPPCDSKHTAGHQTSGEDSVRKEAKAATAMKIDDNKTAQSPLKDFSPKSPKATEPAVADTHNSKAGLQVKEGDMKQEAITPSDKSKTTKATDTSVALPEVAKHDEKSKHSAAADSADDSKGATVRAAQGKEFAVKTSSTGSSRKKANDTDGTSDVIPKAPAHEKKIKVSGDTPATQFASQPDLRGLKPRNTAGDIDASVKAHRKEQARAASDGSAKMAPTLTIVVSSETETNEAPPSSTPQEKTHGKITKGEKPTDVPKTKHKDPSPKKKYDEGREPISTGLDQPPSGEIMQTGDSPLPYPHGYPQGMPLPQPPFPLIPTPAMPAPEWCYSPPNQWPPLIMSNLPQNLPPPPPLGVMPPMYPIPPPCVPVDPWTESLLSGNHSIKKSDDTSKMETTHRKDMPGETPRKLLTKQKKPDRKDQACQTDPPAPERRKGIRDQICQTDFPLLGGEKKKKAKSSKTNQMCQTDLYLLEGIISSIAGFDDSRRREERKPSRSPSRLRASPSPMGRSTTSSVLERFQTPPEYPPSMASNDRSPMEPGIGRCSMSTIPECETQNELAPKLGKERFNMPTTLPNEPCPSPNIFEKLRRAVAASKAHQTKLGSSNRAPSSTPTHSHDFKDCQSEPQISSNEDGNDDNSISSGPSSSVAPVISLPRSGPKLDADADASEPRATRHQRVERWMSHMRLPSMGKPEFLGLVNPLAEDEQGAVSPLPGFEPGDRVPNFPRAEGPTVIDRQLTALSLMARSTGTPERVATPPMPMPQQRSVTEPQQPVASQPRLFTDEEGRTFVMYALPVPGPTVPGPNPVERRPTPPTTDTFRPRGPGNVGKYVLSHEEVAAFARPDVQYSAPQREQSQPMYPPPVPHFTPPDQSSLTYPSHPSGEHPPPFMRNPQPVYQVNRGTSRQPPSVSSQQLGRPGTGDSGGGGRSSWESNQRRSSRRSRRY